MNLNTDISSTDGTIWPGWKRSSASTNFPTYDKKCREQSTHDMLYSLQALLLL